MFMTAVVLEINMNSLLVRDINSGNEILVNFRNSRRFSRGDCIRINYTGTMTMSIPPQISAVSIHRTQGCNPVRPPVMPPMPPVMPPQQSRPSEMTAIIIQRRQDGLTVRDMGNNRIVFVRTPFSRHFCSGQRIMVTYDAIRLNNPPEVTAIDIRAMC